MTAITVYVVTQHDIDENSHYVEGVFTTAQAATDRVVEWFTNAPGGDGQTVSLEDLEVDQYADGFMSISHDAFEDLVFEITHMDVMGS